MARQGTARRRGRPRRLSVAVLVAAAAALPAAACGSASAPGPHLTADGMVAALDLGDFGGGTSPQVDYNPYSVNRLTTSYTFEPLMIINGYTCNAQPWLASSYRWATASTVVFTLRAGVRWSDGKPFTAADVAFSFALLKKNPALDLFGAWGFLKSVQATGTHQVTMTFATNPSSGFVAVNQTVIVPEHVWSTVKDPTTYTNPGAVGTGPFTVARFNGSQLTLRRNPGYWQAGKVQVQEIRFHKADNGGQVDQLALSRGAYDSNAEFIPAIEKSYVSRDPAVNRYWFPPGGIIALAMNLTVKPFDDVAFRRALTYAIRKSDIVTKAEFGYVSAASQTGLVLPRQQPWLLPGVADDGVIPYDPTKAAAMLTAAGYPLRGGKRLGHDGKPLSFTFTVEQGYNDWVSAAGFVRDDLAALGIAVTVQQPAPATATSEKNTGDYQLAFGVFGGQCAMYQNFAMPLASSQTAPIGTAATSNIVRWKDPGTDRLIAPLATATSTAQQKPAVQGLEKVFLDQVPLIPLWYGGLWFEYRTANAVGWPNARDPYAAPSDSLLILTHLTPAPEVH